MSKYICYTKFEPYELLHSFFPGGDELFHVQRGSLRLANISWLLDHQVDPIAALLTMTNTSTAVKAV